MGLQELAAQEGWRLEGSAARVHYNGDGERYSIEYYEPTDAVVYWRILEESETAVPVPRSEVQPPLRERIRVDLDAADVDPAIEQQPL